MKRKLTRIQIRKLLLREVNSLVIQEQARSTSEEDNEALAGKVADWMGFTSSGSPTIRGEVIIIIASKLNTADSTKVNGLVQGLIGLI